MNNICKLCNWWKPENEVLAHGTCLKPSRQTDERTPEDFSCSDFAFYISWPQTEPASFIKDKP